MFHQNVTSLQNDFLTAFYKAAYCTTKKVKIQQKEDGTATPDEKLIEEQPGTDDVDPYHAHLGSTFVPMPVRGTTEEQTIRQTIQQPPCAPPTVSWPSTCATPVNEFNTEGYISCAFPTLFPTGAADFLSPRLSTVTVGNYFKHPMLYHDGRFAKHPQFRYFALNTEMRHRALQTGRIYVCQHPHDAHLTVDDLHDMVGREGEALSNRGLHLASSLCGTRQYWFKQRSQLIALVDTLGLPTVLFTHSAADLQWPELSCLICPEDSQSSTSRSQALMQNPAIADWFFYHRLDLQRSAWRLTFGCDLSGSIAAALMLMVWHVFMIHQMWRICSQKQNQSTQSHVWKQPPLKQATMWLLVAAFITMLAQLVMSQNQKHLEVLFQQQHKWSS